MTVVEVRLYATLSRYSPERKAGEVVHSTLPEGSTVGDLVRNEFKLPLSEIKTVFVNGTAKGFDHVLVDGDRVGIFPPVAGG